MEAPEPIPSKTFVEDSSLLNPDLHADKIWWTPSDEKSDALWYNEGIVYSLTDIGVKL